MIIEWVETEDLGGLGLGLESLREGSEVGEFKKGEGEVEEAGKGGEMTKVYI